MWADSDRRESSLASAFTRTKFFYLRRGEHHDCYDNGTRDVFIRLVRNKAQLAGEMQFMSSEDRKHWAALLAVHSDENEKQYGSSIVG